MNEDSVSMLGHELRSPLSAMLGWAQFLRIATPTREQINLGLEVIERNIKVQSGLIDEMLDLTRLSSGHLRLTIGRIDARSEILFCIEHAHASIASSEVQIEAEIAAATAWVLADQARLRQAFAKLIAHAIEQSPRGGRVRVVLLVNSDSVTFSVRDGSQRLDPTLVVDPLFQRLKSAPTLGVALAWRLIESFGGSVRIDEADGSTRVIDATAECELAPSRGATITIVLPILQA